MKPSTKAFIAIYTSPVFIAAVCAYFLLFIAYITLWTRVGFNKLDSIFTSITHYPYFASTLLTLWVASGLIGIIGYYMWIQSIFIPTLGTKKIGLMLSLGLISAIPLTSIIGFAKDSPIYLSAYILSCYVAGIGMVIDMIFLTTRSTSDSYSSLN